MLLSVRRQMSALFVVGPHAGAHRVAVRAGISMVVPLAGAVAVGQSDLLPYGAIGAFVALYGRHEQLRSRLAMQAQVGAAFATAVLIGAVIAYSSHRIWLLAPVAAVWAGLTAFASERGRWQPAGAVYPTFALAAPATLPLHGSQGFWAVMAVAASAATGLLVTLLLPDLPDPSASVPPASRLPATWESSVLRGHVVRHVAGIGAAGVLVAVTGLGHPYWTFITVSVPLAAPDIEGRLFRSAQRVLGTTAGLGVAAMVLCLHPAIYVTILLISGLQFCTELTTQRNYGLGLVFFTPAALLLGGIVLPAPSASLIAQRAAETGLGLAIVVLVVVVEHRWSRRAVDRGRGQV